jgi:hypothetical protein
MRIRREKRMRFKMEKIYNYFILTVLKTSTEFEK